MRLEAKTHHNWTVIDAATGARLTNVTMLDDESKQMQSIVRGEDRRIVTESDGNGGLRVKQVIERVRAVHIDTKTKTAKVYRVGAAT